MAPGGAPAWPLTPDKMNVTSDKTSRPQRGDDPGSRYVPEDGAGARWSGAGCPGGEELGVSVGWMLKPGGGELGVLVD